MPKVDPWKLERIAAAQCELVTRQLKQPELVAPFVAFRAALDSLDLHGKPTLLDVGCGCGHYGALCARYYPEIVYCGVDYSRAMIEQAKKLCPSGQFRVTKFENVNFWNYDIVLISQVLEYQNAPFAALAHVLSKKYHGCIILHRLRLTEGASHRIESEACYCGYSVPNYEWNLGDLQVFISAHGGVVRSFDKWDGHATLVVVNKE